MRGPIGDLAEWITVQTNAPQIVAVTSLTATGGNATAQTATPHGYRTGDEVEIAGVNEPAYAGRVIVTVLTPDAFLYTVPLATPPTATGTITATYVSDGSGGQADAWHDLATIPAEVQALSGNERLQAQAMTSTVLYRVRVWDQPTGPPVDATMRIKWREHTLQILTVVRTGGMPSFLWLDCAEAD